MVRCTALVLLGVIAFAGAATAAGGEPLDMPVYKASDSFIKSLLDQNGLSPRTTADGDVAVDWHDGADRFSGFVTFDRQEGGQIWDLRISAVMPEKATADIDTSLLVEFANRWNRVESLITLYVAEGNVLVAEHSMLVEYGINPKEFAENGLKRFAGNLGRILSQLSEFASTYKSARQKADTGSLPAQAVGLLEMSDGAYCTASVVADDIILTAAHCLFDEDDKRVKAKRFLAGYANGHAVAEAGIRDDHVPPEFDISRLEEANGIEGYDWAFIRLDRAIGKQTGILAIKSVGESDLAGMTGHEADSLIRVGYGGSRDPMMQRGCQLAHVWDDNTFAHLCHIQPGDSGSPELVLDRGTYSIVGIDTSILDIREVKRANVAVASIAFAGALADFASHPPAVIAAAPSEGDATYGQRQR